MPLCALRSALRAAALAEKPRLPGGPEDAALSAPVARLPSQLSCLRPKRRLFSAGTPVPTVPRRDAPGRCRPPSIVRVAPYFAPGRTIRSDTPHVAPIFLANRPKLLGTVLICQAIGTFFPILRRRTQAVPDQRHCRIAQQLSIAYSDESRNGRPSHVAADCSAGLALRTRLTGTAGAGVRRAARSSACWLHGRSAGGCERSIQGRDLLGLRDQNTRSWAIPGTRT